MKKTSSQLSLFVIRYGFLKLFKVQLHFDVHSIMYYAEQRGVDLEQLGSLKDTNDQVIAGHAYGAYRSACAELVKRPKMSFEKIQKLVNQLPQSEYQQLCDFILAQKIFGKPIFGYVEQKDKKPVQKKRTRSR